MSSPTGTGPDNPRSDSLRSDSPRSESLRSDSIGGDDVDERLGASTSERAGGDPTVTREVNRETVINRPVPAGPTGPTRDTVVARQEQRFGGMKAGASFFGWLTATGLSVLLLALFGAIGVGLGYNKKLNQAGQEIQAGTDTAKTIGLIGAIVLLVVLLVSYYCGGYVAGRMARFDGIRQGLAVWLWGIVAVLVIAALTAIAGADYNIYSTLGLPRLPVKEGTVTATAWIAAAVALVAALVGALLGGLAGMRFHRKVDDAGFETRSETARVR